MVPDSSITSVVAIRSKLQQLKREIQSGRLAYIKVSAGADHVTGIFRRERHVVRVLQLESS
jgi:hypothetical protein